MKQPDSYFEIAELITKFLNNDLTADEFEKLQVWVAESEKHERIWKRLTDSDYLEKKLLYWKGLDPAVYWERLKNEISERPPRWRLLVNKSLKYAAFLLPALLLCGLGWYFIKHKAGKGGADNTGSLAQVHILPQGHVAKLVLGNGRVVALNGSLKEPIKEKDGTQVSSHGGTLRYVSASRTFEFKAVYNTLLVPRGGTYQVTLSDGTKVWLNAASSLRYPTRFSGKSRKVYLSGEAYFEVTKDEHHPFEVLAGKTNIMVLGTKFNVNFYTDNPKQSITLAEGSVRIKESNQHGNDQGVLLKPGFEAVINKNENDIRVRKANVESAIAWKNGMFIFEGESLGDLMRELARWYDVEVVYEDGVDTLFHFTGRIERHENITGILRLLELTGKVNFNVKGREVEVRPVIQGL